MYLRSWTSVLSTLPLYQAPNNNFTTFNLRTIATCATHFIQPELLQCPTLRQHYPSVLPLTLSGGGRTGISPHLLPASSCVQGPSGRPGIGSQQHLRSLRPLGWRSERDPGEHICFSSAPLPGQPAGLASSTWDIGGSKSVPAGRIPNEQFSILTWNHCNAIRALAIRTVKARRFHAGRHTNRCQSLVQDVI